MNAPGPGAAHSSGRGCLLWGGIGVAFLVLGLGAIVFWLATHSTQDPAEARAWAEEMIDLEFPAETPFMGVVWESWAWDLVKAGQLRGYSIGGKARRVEADLSLTPASE